MEGLATRTEIKEKWTIIDLADAHEVLDVKAEYENHAMEQAKKKQGKGGK